MWPEAYDCAACITFDLDAESVWLADDAANARRPGRLSQGRYGPRVAVPLLLAMLDKLALRATFFVPGVVAEAYPQTLTEIAAAGHELAAHGFTHVSPAEMPPEDEERDLLRARTALETFGRPILGYRSPSWELSPRTLGLLARHGFTYSSNLMDDLRPYVHPDEGVVELPVHWALDDAPHFWFDPSTWTKKMATPSEVLEIWKSEYGGIAALGGLFVLTLHPQIIGRPHRLAMLREFLAFLRRQERTWLATCAEVAEHVKRSVVEGGGFDSGLDPAR